MFYVSESLENDVDNFVTQSEYIYIYIYTKNNNTGTKACLAYEERGYMAENKYGENQLYIFLNSKQYKTMLQVTKNVITI